MSDSHAPPPGPEPTAETVIQWSLTGWVPQSPFRGNLQFTDDTGDMILQLPLEPILVRDLRDALSAVLDAQYAAFTQTTPTMPSPETPPSPVAPTLTNAAPPETAQDPTVPNGYWWSSAFKVKVKPGGMKALAILGLGTLALIVISQLTTR